MVGTSSFPQATAVAAFAIDRRRIVQKALTCHVCLVFSILSQTKTKQKATEKHITNPSEFNLKKSHVGFCLILCYTWRPARPPRPPPRGAAHAPTHKEWFVIIRILTAVIVGQHLVLLRSSFQNLSNHIFSFTSPPPAPALRARHHRACRAGPRPGAPRSRPTSSSWAARPWPRTPPVPRPGRSRCCP